MGPLRPEQMHLPEGRREERMSPSPSVRGSGGHGDSTQLWGGMGENQPCSASQGP